MTEYDLVNEKKDTCITFALKPELERLRKILVGIKDSPPQSLLFEGGTEEQRLALAYWWAALLNCMDTSWQTGDNCFTPCLNCVNCLQILNQCHSDILIFDGRISNKDDLGTEYIRAFSMDNIRNLKGILANSPSNARRRVVILMGLDVTRIEAANALLKALEEPTESTVYVLLTSQREQLLPTLVSRSWVLTLPWTGEALQSDDDILEWELCLANFLMSSGTKGSGHGFLSKTSKKGAVNLKLAYAIIQTCQKALVKAITHTSNYAQGVSEKPLPNSSPLVLFFISLTDEQRFFVIDFLNQCQEALVYTVQPARVLDWLATQLYSLHF